jgi:hypothetical protein
VAERFTDCYTRLLQALQLTFDGAPRGLRPALGLMFELRLLAQDVLATPDADGRPTGLCFRQPRPRDDGGADPCGQRARRDAGRP